ncbi:MAG TPA: hypothetical protein ENO22_01145 [candidate division Zixibacteria bacterium]|nr:hypothetical protein [candidate division Zixibacteria bacterium]
MMSEALKTDKSKRRMGVVLNYGTLLLALVCFYIAEIDTWNIPYAIICLAALAGVVYSFMQVHMKTRLWHLAHARTQDLDERQIQVTHESLRHSYTCFTIISLSIFLIADLYKHFSSRAGELTLMPVIAGLIYLAHTLPSSVLAWTER